MRQLKFFSPLLALFFLNNFYSSKTTDQKNKAEVKIATWNNGSFTYYLPTGIKADVEQVMYDSLGIGGVVDSIRVTDPDPHSSQSLPYMEYFVSNRGDKIVFGHRVIKQFNSTTNLWDYYMTTDIGEEQEELGARAWKCTKVAECSGCRPHRTGFLGLGGVDGCPCTNNGEISCSFETSGSGFPWGAVLGFVGVIIAAIIAN